MYFKQISSKKPFAGTDSKQFYCSIKKKLQDFKNHCQRDSQIERDGSPECVNCGDEVVLDILLHRPYIEAVIIHIQLQKVFLHRPEVFTPVTQIRQIFIFGYYLERERTEFLYNIQISIHYVPLRLTKYWLDGQIDVDNRMS